jgi:hypothetical protein
VTWARGAGVGGLAVAGGFAIVTGVALEGREVVVVRATDAAGVVHAMRAWVADADGAEWIEAANPERPILRAARARPADVELQRSSRTRRCAAEVAANPDGHARIRRLLRAKYGWADVWIGLLADTSQSVALRLHCE